MVSFFDEILVSFFQWSLLSGEASFDNHQKDVETKVKVIFFCNFGIGTAWLHKWYGCQYMEQLSHNQQQGAVDLLRHSAAAVQTEDRIYCQSAGQSSRKSNGAYERFTSKFQLFLFFPLDKLCVDLGDEKSV